MFDDFVNLKAWLYKAGICTAVPIEIRAPIASENFISA